MDAGSSNGLHETLGQRIVQAARLAVAMHLADVLLTATPDANDSQRQQSISVSGADELDGFTDEALPHPADDRWHCRRSSPSADGGAA